MALNETPQKQLSLFDSTCLIVGIIIGVGVYQMAPDVAKGAGSAAGVLAVWAVGGFVSLCGALGYAELATAYPREGGDYVYLSRAYGRWAGFLFGWIQLAIVRPGDIVVMAFAFAMYARQIYDPLADSRFPYGQQLLAAAAVMVLTVINMIGVREGKWTQNLLTSVKALGLLAIVVVALIAPPRRPVVASIDPLPVSLALIFVLFSYGGWNEMAYVAAEVKDPRRNIVRALVLGTTAVMVLYLLLNAAFLTALGYSAMASSQAVAADAVATVFPQTSGRLISALVCLSALGAVNGLIFTGARISYAVGADHRVFRLLGKWDGHTGTPIRALIVQAVLALSLIGILGSFVETILFTAPAVYSFYLATSLAVIVLRFREPATERPYRVTGYPVPTLVFCAVCVFLIYSAVRYAVAHQPYVTGWAMWVGLVGLPIYWQWGRAR